MSIVDDWIEKSEADHQAAVALNRRRKKALSDIVCYHCQQCIEKYLKAFLIAQSFAPPRTHDLVQLLNLLPSNSILTGYWCAIRECMQLLVKRETLSK